VQLVLKDRLTEEEERALEDDLEERNAAADETTEDGAVWRADKTKDVLPVDMQGLPADHMDGVTMNDSVQVGRESITKRDSRICYHFEFLLVVLLATTFVAMSLEYRRVFDAFQAREMVKRIFVDQPVLNSTKPSFVFDEIYSADKMWLWLNQAALVSSVAPTLGSNCSTFLGNASYVLTSMTLNQLRVPPNTNCASLQVNGVPQPCYGSFVGPQQNVPYPVVPQDPLIQDAFIFNATQSRYQGTSCTAWPSIFGDTFPGLYEFYPAQQLNFYSVQLNTQTATSQVARLQSNFWVDASTRLLTAQMTAFEQSSGAIVSVIAAFEFLPNGAILPKWNSIPLFLQINDDSFDLAFLILSLILIGLNFVSYALSGFRSHGAAFLDALLLIFILLYFAGNQQLDSWIENCQVQVAASSLLEIYLDTRGVAFLYQLVGNFMGIVVVLFAIRLGKHLDGSPSSSRILRALSKAIPQYVSLIFLVATVVSCFAFMAHFILGRSSAGFYVADLAFASLWISFTVTNSGAYVGVAHWGAIVLSIAAYIVLFFALLWVCFSVTAAAYISVSDEIRSKGYFWMAGSRAAMRYADDVVGASGAIKGYDAHLRQRSHQGAKRVYGE